MPVSVFPGPLADSSSTGIVPKRLSARQPDPDQTMPEIGDATHGIRFRIVCTKSEHMVRHNGRRAQRCYLYF